MPHTRRAVLPRKRESSTYKICGNRKFSRPAPGRALRARSSPFCKHNKYFAKLLDEHSELPGENTNPEVSWRCRSADEARENRHR